MPKIFSGNWVFLIILILLASAGFFVGSRTETLDNLNFFPASLADSPIYEPERLIQPAQNPPSADIEAGPSQSLPQESLVGEQLDDIAEKLDLIQRQINDIGASNLASNPKPQIPNPNDQTLEVDEPVVELEPEPELETQVVVQQSSQTATTGGGGGGAKPIYQKILISEIQIASEDDEKEEFVELFNPNNTDLDLTGWYLQKKTETGSDYLSYASSTLFSGKTILAKNYFLICREDYNPGVSCDIITSSSLTEDNALIFKNPNREISDKLGFGNAQDFELLATVSPGTGQSIGRKWANGAEPASQRGEQDTDNNFLDFELNSPTPKSQNITYIEPVEPEPEPADTTPPEVIFNLNAIQNNLNFSINFEITDPLDAVTPSGLASYIFKWQEQGLEWQEDDIQNIDGAPEIYSGIRDFSGENGKTYYFQIKAKDIIGNESIWLPDPPAITTVSAPDFQTIVINEIQIEPIKQRFVELYNPNPQDIDLTGWYLQRKKENNDSWDTFVSSTNFEGKTISGNGYFIISRELENSDILINIALKEDNSLALKNSGREIVDKVGWGEAQDFETAPAQNPLESKSITRTGGADTDDNSQDFIISETPTPGA